MMDKEGETSAVDRVLDLFLEEAAVIAAAEIGDSYPEAEPVAFSAAFEQRMERVFKEAGHRARMRKIGKFSRRAAVVLLAVIVTFTLMVFGVKAWRTRLLNLFVTETPTAVIINFEENAAAIETGVIFGFIPEGFVLTESKNDPDVQRYAYQAGDESFVLSRVMADRGFVVDKEDAVLKRITINGYEAFMSVTNDYYILVWSDFTFAYRLTGNMEEAVFIQIAENIH